MHRLAEIADARINPIMLKEVYQAFRSRTLLGGSLRALAIPLVTYLTLVSAFWPRSSSDEGLGGGFFAIVAGVMALVTCIMLPVSAGLQLQTEVRSRTLDLIALTALSPWQIASGRFQATLLQILLVFSYMGPFAVAAVAMGGISVPRVLGVLLAVLLMAMLQASASLMAATMVIFNERLRGVGWLLFGLEVWFLASVVLSSSFASPGRSTGLTWWLVGIALTLTAFFLRLTADALTPATTRCYGPSKLALLPLLAVLVLPAVVDDGSDSTTQEIVTALGMLTLIFFVMLWSGSRQATAGEERFLYPLRNGYESTLIYAGFVTAALSALLLTTSLVPWWLPISFLYYYFAITGVAVLMHSLLPRSWRTTQAYYGVVVALVIINLFGTGLVAAANDFNGVSYALVPFSGWRVFLPLTLDGPESVQWPWFGAPPLVATASIWMARRRNKKLA